MVRRLPIAVLIASVTMLAAPLDEPARPARSRTRPARGAAVSVLIVTASGDRPRRRMLLPAIFVWPNDGALLGLSVHRTQQRVDVDECAIGDAGQQRGPLGQCDQEAGAVPRQLPGVAVGEFAQKDPQRGAARTHRRTACFIPPDRITSRSSMLSAPRPSRR